METIGPRCTIGYPRAMGEPKRVVIVDQNMLGGPALIKLLASLATVAAPVHLPAREPEPHPPNLLVDGPTRWFDAPDRRERRLEHVPRDEEVAVSTAEAKRERRRLRDLEQATRREAGRNRP